MQEEVISYYKNRIEGASNEFEVSHILSQIYEQGKSQNRKEEIRSRVLQCAVPGSGNYLTWRIVSRLQKENGVYRSFKRASGISCFIEQFVDKSIIDFPEEFEHDDIREGGVEFRYPGFRLVKVDLSLVDEVSSLIWSHSMPYPLPFTRRTHKIYIIRDGRDVVSSIIHKMVRPRHLKINPDFKCTSVEELLDMEVDGQGYVERQAHKWRKHVECFLEYCPSKEWLLIKYEDLSGERKTEIVRVIADWLGLECSASTLEKVMSETAKPDVRLHAPGFIWRGEPGGHKILGITERVENVCADLLERFEYL
jgi:hypothetical protein